MASRLEYLEYFLDRVDHVESGRKGAVSDSKWLISNYKCEFYSVLEKHLKNRDQRVRKEVVLLLTALKERQALETIREMRMKDNDNIGMVCLGYLSSIDEEDELIPKLIEILEYKRGDEFKKAAERISSAGSSKDVPTLRRIYGQVTGDMRSQMRAALESLIDKDQELKKKKDLLLSVPIFPREKEFERFLKSSEDYLDVRYRNSVHPKKMVSTGTYNNIVRGLKNIRIRLFNEYDNLEHYSEDHIERYNRIVDLLSWASDDIIKKEIMPADESTACPKCGSAMIFGNGEWKCVECGMN